MYPSLLITALMLASCFTTTSRGAAETEAQNAPSAPSKTPMAYPFPAVKEGISIKAGTDGDTKLTQLLNDFSRVTGNTLLITKEVRTQLENSSTGLNRSLDVPADRVYPIVESILVHNDFVLSLRSEREPRLIAVESANSNRRSPLRSGALVATERDLDAWSQHPAFLVTTILDLPNTDVRTLSNSMRTMFTDQNTQVIIPVGNSNSLIITANGADLAMLAKMLRTVDETSRREAEESHKLAPLQPAPKSSATKESPAKEPAKPSLENPPK
jgi:hypothetical protein